MKTHVLLLTTFCGVFAYSAQADDAGKAEALVKSHGCMVCHTVNSKLVGPSYKDVSAKYRSDENALATLMKKVKEGGSGVWGQIPMPPHPDISDTDLKAMVDWVLSTK